VEKSKNSQSDEDDPFIVMGEGVGLLVFICSMFIDTGPIDCIVTGVVAVPSPVLFILSSWFIILIEIAASCLLVILNKGAFVASAIGLSMTARFICSCAEEITTGGGGGAMR